MKIYPQDAAERLGFGIILKELSREAETPLVKSRLLDLQPSHDPGFIREKLNQTKAYQRLWTSADFPRETTFRDVSTILKKVHPENAWLSQEELFKIILWLRGLKVFLLFIERKKEEFPELVALIPQIDRPFPFLDFLFKHFTPEGVLRDDASPELLRLRRAILDTSQKVRRLTEKLHKSARDQGWTDAREISIRNNRLVIPMNSDFKGRINGFVQDVSQSGQTIFIEPAEALPLNNELSVLMLKERQEIIRILSALTSDIRMKLPELTAWETWLNVMEELQARAKFSIRLKSEIPILDSSGDCLKIVQGRNPILSLQSREKVIPLDMEINRDARIILISGPNAGGKSVALKTSGLLQWMVQCGLPVPADSASTFPVLTALFAVLGDGQSIENDLSTYTAHLAHMRLLLEKAHELTLFLIDEFGSGTDPRSGGPIAVAILEALVEKGALGVVTTHYSDLKQLGRRNPAVRNAAMYFDISSFSPSYRLEMGHAGSSYAFEIAKKAGISSAILKRGKALMGKASADTEELLASLNREQKDILSLKQQLQSQTLELELAKQKWINHEEDSKIKARKIIQDAREQARKMILEASRQIESIVTETREKQLEKKVAKSVQKELLSLIPEAEILASENKKVKLPGYKEAPGVVPVPGDKVRWLSTGAIGEVLDQIQERFVVAFGEMRISLKREELMVLHSESEVREIKSAVRSVNPDGKMHATTILDIRGQRHEAALILLQKFMDDALVNGLPFVHIIHGKGNGILRKMTRDFLKSMPGVKKIQEPPIEQGGAGATDAVLD